MKASELRNIIREEVDKVMSEDMFSSSKPDPVKNYARIVRDINNLSKSITASADVMGVKKSLEEMLKTHSAILKRIGAKY